MPFFSIIIPVYNAHPYLRACLDSVLSQLDPDWECVCVDDGSTDGSAWILDEYAHRDKRFRVIHQENQGVSVARNVGLIHSAGEWITWLDADDIYALARLSEARRIIENTKPDLIRFRTCMGKPGEDAFPKGIKTCNHYVVFEGAKARIWGWNILMPAGMLWTWVARKELLGGLMFRPGMRIKEDCVYCGNFVNRFCRVVQSDFIAYFYRHVPTSAMHSVRKADDCLLFLDAIGDLCKRERHYVLNVPDVARAMYSRLRTQVECDVLDWIRLQYGENSRNIDIRNRFRKLREVSLFSYPSLLPRCMRLLLAWWSATGQVWQISFFNLLVRMVRKYIGRGRP